MFPESTTERAPVSRESIVHAALGLLAEGGLDAVSFRRIAKVLGVSGPRSTGTSRTSASSWT